MPEDNQPEVIVDLKMDFIEVVEYSKDENHHLCVTFYLGHGTLSNVVDVERINGFLFQHVLAAFLYDDFDRRLIHNSCLLSCQNAVETGLKRGLTFWVWRPFILVLKSLRNNMLIRYVLSWSLTTESMIDTIMNILILIWTLITKRICMSHRNIFLWDSWFRLWNLIFNEFKQIIWRNSLIQIFLEAQWQDISNLFVRTTIYSSSHQIVTHFRICWVFLGSLANQHFIKYYAHAPDITFVCVYVFSITFRAHICWRTYVIKHLWLFGLIQKFTEAEIRYSSPCICKKNIGCFQITMDNLFLFKGNISIDNISKNWQSLELAQFSLFFDILLKISILAKLSHNINVIFCHKYLYGFEYMIVIYGSQSIYLVV